MSKIVIDARIINSSTGRYIEKLLNNLENIDKINKYYILVPKKDLNFYRPRNSNFSIIEANFDSYSLEEQLGLLKLLNQIKPDLVHFCMPQQPILYRGRAVTTVHDLTLFKTYNSDKNWFIYKFKQLIGRFVFYIVGHKSSHIICPSNYTKNEYAKFAKISADKITVTYEGCDFANVEPKTYEPLQNNDFIMYVGQQSDYKNIRRLMMAHQNLIKTMPNLKLALVGRLDGKNGKPLKINQKWASDQDFKNIIYTDYVDDAQLRWLFEHCATYVFPSLMEGFGLPGLEAMASKAPVVSSNATCLPEIYGNSAYYFDPTNVAEMTAAIRDVITNKEIRDRLIKEGSKTVKKYSWHDMSKQTLDVYNQVLNN